MNWNLKELKFFEVSMSRFEIVLRIKPDKILQMGVRLYA